MTIVCTSLYIQLAVADIDYQELESSFQRKLNRIDSFMQENHAKAMSEPAILMAFVDEELLTVWSAKNTIRAMLGPKRWSQLSDLEQEQLVKAYTQTMRRYLFEVFQRYQGQTAMVKGIRLNDKQNKGWLTVELQSDSLPDLSIDLKIYQESGHWTIYDFSFQGISFVKMKQGYFQTTFDQNGIEGILVELERKNQAFIKQLEVAKQ